MSSSLDETETYANGNVHNWHATRATQGKRNEVFQTSKRPLPHEWNLPRVHMG